MSKALLDAMPRPAVLVSASGRLDAANDAAIRLFGAQSVGRHYVTVLRQPSLLDAIEKASAEDVAVAAQFLTSEARRDITMMAYCAPVRPGGGILVTFEDQTEMAEAGQIRRDFVANVSHELRTPLTALLGFLETLRGPARDDASARERFLGIMHKEAQRMNRLVGDLLSLSRLESQERIRPKDVTDVSAIVRSVANTLSAMAADLGVVVHLDLTDEDMRVPGDADQLSQVMTNLLENAIKYSGEGAEVRVSVRSEDRNPFVMSDAAVIVVSDTGPGIDQLHLPRLTERFYRIDSHRSRELGGTGLGLAIVKHIVNRHRGRLRIESELGQGSRFIVILPKSAAELTPKP